MTARYSASIGNDPIDGSITVGCRTAEAAAMAARGLADFGEIITIYGPRAGKTEWKAVGTGCLAGVWRK